MCLWRQRRGLSVCLSACLSVCQCICLPVCESTPKKSIDLWLTPYSLRNNPKSMYQWKNTRLYQGILKEEVLLYQNHATLQGDSSIILHQDYFFKSKLKWMMPSSIFQYDQGEDRWLCTLLLQQGVNLIKLFPLCHRFRGKIRWNLGLRHFSG
jgi:hypothetical protein